MTPIKPAFVDDLDVEAPLLEEGEHPERIARLGEDVDILRRPDDPGIAGQSVGARQQERDARFRHEADHFFEEAFGRTWGLEIVWRGKRLVDHPAA